MFKKSLVAQLQKAGHEVIDFGAHKVSQVTTIRIFVVPLGRRRFGPGGARESPFAEAGWARPSAQNKVQAHVLSLIHDHFSARQVSRTIT